LPKETASSYALRRRRHNRELLDKSSRLVQSSFVVRLLYKDCILIHLLGLYLLFILLSFMHLTSLSLCVLSKF